MNCHFILSWFMNKVTTEPRQYTWEILIIILRMGVKGSFIRLPILEIRHSQENRIFYILYQMQWSGILLFCNHYCFLFSDREGSLLNYVHHIQNVKRKLRILTNSSSSPSSPLTVLFYFLPYFDDFFEWRKCDCLENLMDNKWLSLFT